MLNLIKVHLRWSQAIMNKRLINIKEIFNLLKGTLFIYAFVLSRWSQCPRNPMKSWYHVILDLIRSFIVYGHQHIDWTYWLNFTFILCSICQSYKVLGASDHVQPLPLNLMQKLELRLVLELCQVFQPISVGPKVLIKWTSLPNFETTWEVALEIMPLLLNFYLQDMVDLNGESIDMEPLRTYASLKWAIYKVLCRT